MSIADIAFSPVLAVSEPNDKRVLPANARLHQAPVSWSVRPEDNLSPHARRAGPQSDSPRAALDIRSDNVRIVKYERACLEFCRTYDPSPETAAVIAPSRKYLRLPEPLIRGYLELCNRRYP